MKDYTTFINEINILKVLVSLCPFPLSVLNIVLCRTIQTLSSCMKFGNGMRFVSSSWSKSNFYDSGFAIIDLSRSIHPIEFNQDLIHYFQICPIKLTNNTIIRSLQYTHFYRVFFKILVSSLTKSLLMSILCSIDQKRHEINKKKLLLTCLVCLDTAKEASSSTTYCKRNI